MNEAGSREGKVDFVWLVPLLVFSMWLGRNSVAMALDYLGKPVAYSVIVAVITVSVVCAYVAKRRDSILLAWVAILLPVLPFLLGLFIAVVLVGIFSIMFQVN